MRDFKKIQVWHKAHKFVLEIYKASENFPPEERFGLQSQIRRASASIPTNIAEGAGRETQQEFARFIHIASGSASEVKYQLLLAHDLGYLNAENYQNLEKNINEIQKMLHGFAKALKSSS